MQGRLLKVPQRLCGGFYNTVDQALARIEQLPQALAAHSGSAAMRDGVPDPVGRRNPFLDVVVVRHEPLEIAIPVTIEPGEKLPDGLAVEVHASSKMRFHKAQHLRMSSSLKAVKDYDLNALLNITADQDGAELQQVGRERFWHRGGANPIYIGFQRPKPLI